MLYKYVLQQETPHKIALVFCQIEDPVHFPRKTYHAYFYPPAFLKYSHMLTVSIEAKTHDLIYKCLDDDELGHEWE